MAFPAPSLKVQGTRFVTQGGKPQRIVGVDILGGATQSTYQKITQLNCNFARIACHWEDIELNAPTGSGTDYSTYSHTFGGAGSIIPGLDAMCTFFNQNNIYFIIDIHQAGWSTFFSGNGGIPPWYYTDSRFPGATIPSDKGASIWNFWTSDATVTGSHGDNRVLYKSLLNYVVNRYAQYANCIGFEVFNEPNPGSWPTGSGYDNATNTMLTWQNTMVDYINSIDPSRAIFVSTRGGGQGVFSADYTILGLSTSTLLNPQNIVLDCHAYYTGLSPGFINGVGTAGQVGLAAYNSSSPPGDEWYPDDTTTHINLNPGYVGTFANQEQVHLVYLNRANSFGIPLVMGEWGCNGNDTGRLTYQRQMFQLFDKYSMNMSRWNLGGSGTGNSGQGLFDNTGTFLDVVTDTTVVGGYAGGLQTYFASVAASNSSTVAIATKNKISASSSTTSVNIANPPNSTVSGDYLVAEVTAAGTTTSPSPPSNAWTPIHEAPVTGLYHGLWAKFATSSTDGSGTWTVSGASSVSVTITGYSGVNPSTPVRMHTSGTATGAITITPANATGIVANDEVIIATATTAGPRPWPNSGALLGCLPDGGPVVYTQTAMTSFENTGNTKVAVGNVWASWTFASPWPDSGTTKGANADFANNRLSMISWPVEQSWPQTGAKGTAAGDPTTTFTAICNGTYDTLFAQNALKMKQYGHPLWFRPYCELEGGDHPWEAGWVLSANVSTYVTKFNQGWQRLWIITKGTQAQVNALSPAYTGTSVNGGNAVQADNVMFFWNPTNTVQYAQATRDKMYPGDPWVQMAGTEAYLPDGPVGQSYSQTLDSTLSSGGATEVPIYTYYTPGNAFSAGGKIIGHGEAGNRWKGSSDTTAAISRTNTFGQFIQTHPGVKLFVWWNGGSSTGTGSSQIESHPAALLTADQNFFNLSYMHPTLDVTVNTPTGWSEVYQYRTRLGATGVNYGAGMAGTQHLNQTATGTSVTAPAIKAYGYGNWSAITTALVPAGGGGNVAPFGGTVTIDNMTPNFDGVHTVTLTATPSGWSGNPAIVSGDYSYQWKRDGTTNIGTNSAQYTVVAGDVGHTIQVNLTVNNGVTPNGTAQATTAAVTNSGTAPVNTVAPTVPANPSVGTVQTATQGTWTGATSFSFQWQRVTASTQNISGATSLTYTPTSADNGARLQIAVTAWSGANQTGSSTTVTSAPSNAISSAVNAYPSYINYPTFSGLPATAPDNYTSFAGVVDSTSNANTEDNRECRAVVRIGRTDYWGGAFTQATSPGGNPIAVTGLVGVNADTGALTSFRPTLDGKIWGMCVSPDSAFLYIFGDFNHVNGSVRNGCAKFRVSDGSLDTSWSPSANGSVRHGAVSPDNTTVYIGGQFTTMNGTTRNYLAAVDNTTGALVSGFNVSIGNTGTGATEVRKVAFAPNDPNHLYIMGLFNQITVGSTTSSRLALAQLNLPSGSVTSWAPDLTGNTGTTIGHDMDFLSNGSAIFCSFAGSDTGGDGNTFMRYELSPIRNARTWSDVMDGDVNSIATNDTYVWAGTHGDGTQNTGTIINVASRKIVCVRASDGTDTSARNSLWSPNPQFNGIKGTYCIVVADDALLCSGTWSTPNQSAASFSATAASLHEFSMEADTLSGVTLAPGQSAQVLVDFSPAVVGARTATFTINSNGGNANVVLNGNGITGGPVISTQPPTTIDFGQVALVNKLTTATFTFTDSQSGVTFLGSLDNAPFVTVTSPLTFSNLTTGTHTFQLKANTAAGGDSPITSYTWTISP